MADTLDRNDMEKRAEIARELANSFIAKGMLIEAGFRSLMVMAYDNVPAEQVEQMRNVFFAGAQHLFGAIMQTLDAGDDPTPADLTRMDNIAQELERFIHEFSQRHREPGQA